MRLALLAILAAACRNKADDTAGSECDADTDADADADADADGDADTDTDTDADCDTDTDTEVEPECVDLAPVVADCEALVKPVESDAGDYYDAIDPDSDHLLADLSSLVGGHTRVGYDSLWEAFESTDARDDGRVWDLYSDVPDGEPAYLYDFEDDRCGEYGGEGDCYNREHTWPQSWFGSSTDVKSDLHSTLPVDGYVNSIRSDLPYGLVGTSTWTSTNGSLRGDSEQCGYSGRVFEPIDAYKGDLARAWLYVATRYRSEAGDWGGSEATDGAHLEPWAEELVRAWHIADPVDERELARNAAVSALQGNRNPYVDHPEWVCRIEDF